MVYKILAFRQKKKNHNESTHVIDDIISQSTLTC